MIIRTQKTKIVCDYCDYHVGLKKHHECLICKKHLCVNCRYEVRDKKKIKTYSYDNLLIGYICHNCFNEVLKNGRKKKLGGVYNG